ncbi:MAG: hypothetical protein IJE10_01290 [Clostridia bacterium]|nr:hypothetical protein [Clostridia bacterium]
MRKFSCAFLIVLLICMTFLCVSTVAYTYENELNFPAYGQEDKTAVSTATLTGNGTAVTFKKITASDGKSYIQRQTTVNGVAVDDYTDGLGFLVMYATSTTPQNWYGGTNENYPKFVGSYNAQSFSTANVFAGGYPSWVTMSDMTIGTNKVTMTGENDFAKITAIWYMTQNDKDPKVDLTISVKKTGYYSFGMFTSPKSFSKDSMKFIQVPFRYSEKGLPTDCYLVSEAYSTASVSQVTTNTGTKIANKDVTYGIFVDPKSIVSEGDASAKTMRWVKSNAYYGYYDDNFTYKTVDSTAAQSNYGLSIRGKDGNVQPGAFAPIMGTADSNFIVDGVYRITYRPMVTVSEPAISSWYDNYKRVLTDYLNVTDYRDNYYASMTDTIFNMTDLAMDDFYGGWSDDGKAHYNMEGRNVVSDADPLSYMQLYLLTEDNTILNERTIPSMEFILSRSSAIYNAYGRMDNVGTAHGYGSPAHMVNALLANSDTLSTGYTAMGFPADKEGTEGIGNSSYYGAYKMTMGMMPYYQYLAAIRLNGTYISKASQSGVKNPSEYLWQSRALALNKPDTDDETAEKQLSRAKTHGGWYVDRRVNLNYTDAQVANGAHNVPNDQLFIFKDFMPNIHCLLELYEETKEQKYLDAAQESARRLITTLWSTYMPEEDENYVIDSAKASYINQIQKGNTANQMWWHGDTRFRLGEADDAWNANTGYIAKWNSTAPGQTATTVPAWTVSRVGLGIEQTTTFAYYSGNIIMSTWAPDLMRIAELTGDEMLETFARNALVGRFANYPSYYLTEYSTYQQQKNFPYTGPDTTQIYYHHIPVMISMLQDFLISQAYAWSDKLVDFPSVRSQGYHYYSSRHYGFAPGKIFNEKDMWLWMKKGLITVDNKQIDWFGARKDGRAAFVFTNASDESVTTNVTFGDEVNMASRVNSITYTSGAANATKVIENKATTVTVPPKTTVAIAFNANVEAPGFAKMYGTDLTDTSNSHVKSSVINENDVIGNVVQISPDSYNVHVYSTYRPTSVDADNGISRMIIRYSIGGESWKAETDLTFPFEFSIPVSDSSKNFKYKVELYDKNSTKVGTSEECTLSASYIKEEVPVILTTTTTHGTTVSATGNPTISGWGAANNTKITQTGNCFAFFKMGNDSGVDVPLTLIFTLYDSNNNFKRIAKVVNTSISASSTTSSPVNISTKTDDPIVLTENDMGDHFVVYVWSDLNSIKPYMHKYDFTTGKTIVK